MMSCSLNQPITTLVSITTNLRLLCQFSISNFLFLSQLGYSSFLGNSNFYDYLVVRLRFVQFGL